jgi:hypothetical protein
MLKAAEDREHLLTRRPAARSRCAVTATMALIRELHSDDLGHQLDGWVQRLGARQLSFLESGAAAGPSAHRISRLRQT